MTALLSKQLCFTKQHPLMHTRTDKCPTHGGKHLRPITLYLQRVVVMECAERVYCTQHMLSL